MDCRIIVISITITKDGWFIKQILYKFVGKKQSIFKWERKENFNRTNLAGEKNK